jgi:hypothetical protein
MLEFSLMFHLAPFESLDNLALLARQDYNLGGVGSWFSEFRGGLYGFYSRLYGVSVHYDEVHSWLPRVRLPRDTEHHLASIFFNMDSAFECLVFALNALGWAAVPSGFRDVSDGKALRSISPIDILGEATGGRARLPLPGYTSVFPHLQALWQEHSTTIARIRDLHDVSKHRRTIFAAG